MSTSALVRGECGEETTADSIQVDLADTKSTSLDKVLVAIKELAIGMTNIDKQAETGSKPPHQTQ